MNMSFSSNVYAVVSVTSGKVIGKHRSAVSNPKVNNLSMDVMDTDTHHEERESLCTVQVNLSRTVGNLMQIEGLPVGYWVIDGINTDSDLVLLVANPTEFISTLSGNNKLA